MPKETTLPLAASDMFQDFAEIISIDDLSEKEPAPGKRVFHANLTPNGFITNSGGTGEAHAFIAVDTAKKGFPALGGTRILWGSGDGSVSMVEAEETARGLAGSMTPKNIWIVLLMTNFAEILDAALEKSAISSLDEVLKLIADVDFSKVNPRYCWGGLKGTIWFSCERNDLPESVRLMAPIAYGKFASSVLPDGGCYVSVDAGTCTGDMSLARIGCGDGAVPLVGFPEQHGGAGDPSLLTAGCNVAAIHEAAKVVFPDRELSQLSIAVEGAAGKVGYPLAKSLLEDGVGKLFVTDLAKDRLELLAGEFGDRIEIVSHRDNAIYFTGADIIVPVSARFQQWTPTLATAVVEKQNGKRAVIVGSQNCLVDPASEAETIAILQAGNVLLAPDPSLSGGGVLTVSFEARGPFKLLSGEEQREARQYWPTVVGPGLGTLLRLSSAIDLPPTTVFHAICEETKKMIPGEPYFSALR